MGTSIQKGLQSLVGAAKGVAAKAKVGAPSAPKISVGTTPTGPKADAWEGVGTHSNPYVYEGPKPGVPATSAAAIARGEQQIVNLHPQVTRIYVNPGILKLQDPTFARRDPADFAVET